jgi:hypothetical protein
MVKYIVSGRPKTPFLAQEVKSQWTKKEGKEETAVLYNVLFLERLVNKAPSNTARVPRLLPFDSSGVFPDNNINFAQV